jgi:hypothetical protein
VMRGKLDMLRVSWNLFVREKREARQGYMGLLVATESRSGAGFLGGDRVC